MLISSLEHCVVVNTGIHLRDRENVVAVVAKPYDDLLVNAFRPRCSSARWLQGIDDVCLERLGRECEGGLYALPCETRMGLEHLLDAFSRRQFIQDELNRNARASDYRLTHHHGWIELNQFL